MPNLYIIAGCNGAGKTTASYTVLPEMLECDEFINADEIAKGLSPFNPEKAAIESGRIMLDKISKLISQKVDFAFETTLATKSYINTIQKAKSFGYDITLVFFWLDSVELAIERVKIRVEEGGHSIPVNVIKRRYLAGLKNLFQLYMSESSYWMIFNNSSLSAELIAEGYNNYKINIQNKRTFEIIKKISQDDSRK
jgi:predicted ABC-type ATPase